MLENLDPTPRIQAQAPWKPAIVFEDGEGEATTNGYHADERPDFDSFLEEAGFDASKYEIVGEPRTSRWQVARPFPLEPEWLTAYKFRFRHKANASVDLPLLWSTAKKNVRKPKPVDSDKVLVVALSDFQIGKVDERGGTQELVTRIFEAYDRIEAKMRKGKYQQIVLVDVGDIIEGFSNSADMNQAVTNDLDLMQQVDVAISLVWEITKRAVKYAPVKYLSVASNHCQFRLNKQRVGRPGEADWGIMIAKQLNRLAKETDLPITIHIPRPEDESLAVDVFGNNFHVLGVWHGHQAARPEGHSEWWKKQAFGHQPVHAATIGLVGHHHHLRIQELGESSNGGSRYLIQTKTMDSGSGWYRLNAGEDSQVGIVCFELQDQVHFQGSIEVM